MEWKKVRKGERDREDKRGGEKMRSKRKEE